LISHAYLDDQYQSKLRHLAASVQLRLITPNRFRFAYRNAVANPTGPRSFEWITHPSLFPVGIRTSTRWMLATGDLGLRQYRPDIIHVENEIHSFIVLQAILSRRLYTPTARIVLFVWANQQLVGPKRWLLDPLSRYLYGRIAFYITGSRGARQLLLERGVPSERTMVIPQIGLEVDYFAPPSVRQRSDARQALGLTEDDFVVGFVGRFVEAKGLGDLVMAVKHSQSEHNWPRLRLLCVGEGPLREMLLGEPSAMVAVSSTSAGLLRYYHAMDVLVLPSRTTPGWTEQFGRVLIEGMAAGVPVVGSTSGAVPEVIGDAGLLFTEGNVQELAGRLRILQSDGTLREQLSVRGRQRAITHFSSTAIAEATVCAYHRTLDQDFSAPGNPRAVPR
jgi:glycosyltransferase involved in cell wall biosynthesis